jgi:hypothetical protein
MKTKVLLFLFILLLTQSMKAQDYSTDRNDSLKLKDRIFFGGNLGLQFGGFTYIEIAPIMGLHLTEKIDIGSGILYTYSKNNVDLYTNQLYGANIYGQATIFKPVIAHAQFEILQDNFRAATGEISSQWFQAVLVGGGIKQPIGERGYSYLLVLWNLNNSYDSPYSNPIIKVGIIF